MNAGDGKEINMFQCQKELLDSMYCTPTTTSDIFNVVCVCSAQNTVFAFSKSVNDEFFNFTNISAALWKSSPWVRIRTASALLG